MLSASGLGASAVPPPSGGHQLIGRQLHSACGIGAKALWPLRLLRVLNLLLILVQTKQAQRRLTAFSDQAQFPAKFLDQAHQTPPARPSRPPRTGSVSNRR